MKILDIEKRDVYFVLEFPVKHLLHIKNLLDHASIEFDGEKEPEMKEAVEYMNKQMVPLLRWVEQYSKNEGVVDGPPPNTQFE